MGDLAYDMKMLNYSSKEKLIGILVIPPVAIAIDYFIFGRPYFKTVGNFLIPTLVTATVVLIVYMLCSMTQRFCLTGFPKYSQAFQTDWDRTALFHRDHGRGDNGVIFWL
jgi:hypothetical protein